MKMPDYYTTENPGGYGLEFNTEPDDSKIQVEIITLDSLNLENVSFIKIDVEGHEPNVINGSLATIQRCKPVMIVEILGGVTLETASHEQLEYINNTKLLISSLGYDVKLIKNCDYLCIPAV